MACFTLNAQARTQLVQALLQGTDAVIEDCDDQLAAFMDEVSAGTGAIEVTVARIEE